MLPFLGKVPITRGELSQSEQEIVKLLINRRTIVRANLVIILSICLFQFKIDVVIINIGGVAPTAEQPFQKK